MTGVPKIAVIGAGAWGTALALTARRAGTEVQIWARDADVADAINRDHGNPDYLPDVALDPAIRATIDLAAAVAESEALLLVVPAQHVREVIRGAASALPPGIPLVIASKGIEVAGGATMREVLQQELPGHPLAVLSGPTFAGEVARGLPTAATLATEDPALGARLLQMIATASFRLYLSDDPVGCEIGGAVKNVLAIACGIVTGRALGENARAALITRGLAELVRLAVAKGANPATLMGLSGIGDLALTCTAMQSRNYSLGIELGQGRSLEQVLNSRRSIAEGVATAAAVATLAGSLGIEMPIVAGTDAILHHGAAIDDEIRKLLSRPFKAEAAG